MRWPWVGGRARLGRNLAVGLVRVAVGDGPRAVGQRDRRPERVEQVKMAHAAAPLADKVAIKLRVVRVVTGT